MLTGTRPIAAHPARHALVTDDLDAVTTALESGYALVGALWDGATYVRVLEK